MGPPKLPDIRAPGVDAAGMYRSASLPRVGPKVKVSAAELGSLRRTDVSGQVDALRTAAREAKADLKAELAERKQRSRGMLLGKSSSTPELRGAKARPAAAPDAAPGSAGSSGSGGRR
ncbi:unnamed protein product, partial [Prorocentrum cordatum]